MFERGAAPALGVIELSSIARGFVVADAMLKRAQVALLQSRPVSPGKHVIVVAGAEEDVAQAMAAGANAAGDALLDRLTLPGAHALIGPAVAGAVRAGALDSVGVVETATIASTILAADAACKAADVAIVEMRLAIGIGGKGFFTLTGSLAMIEAALAAAACAIDAKLLVGRELIANPHEDFGGKLLR
ncbi:MAG: BMC domain-containing protein [Myxococcota bacterium]